MVVSGFWQNRRVLLTGHTGFKGAWAALWLERAGAKVTGFALPPEDESLFSCLQPWNRINSIIGDLNDRDAVHAAVASSDPEIVIHMAAQALVRRSYRTPIDTFATNIMGTANLLAAAGACRSLKAILVITSDKVYDNRDQGRAFREDDALAGDDPYSASKAAAEIVVRSWRHSFFHEAGAPALATARAGNVIGGGDWGEDRLVPDVIRAGIAGKPVVLRYPNSTRPWQHVFDVLHGYLSYAEKLAVDPADMPTAVNFGPAAQGIATKLLVDILQKNFGWHTGWQTLDQNPLPEKAHLNLDPALAEHALDWRTRLPVDRALALVADWHRAHLRGEDMRQFSLAQIADYERLLRGQP
nr:CDP-glucose 4,6-dehydratase [Rhizomicrobium electricum]